MKFFSLTFSTSVSGMKKDKLVICNHGCIPVGPLNVRFSSAPQKEGRQETGGCGQKGMAPRLWPEGTEMPQSMVWHV